MRTRLSLTIATLLLPVPVAVAQVVSPFPTAPALAAPAPETPPALGTIDFGGMLGDTDGDEARYERYTDTRDSVWSNITLFRESSLYVFDARAFHVGYRDQRYGALFNNGRVNVNFQWDSIPTNFGYNLLTPYARNGNTLTLDDAAQLSVQNRLVSGVPCAYATSCTNPTTAGVAKSTRSIYNGLAEDLELRMRRDTASLGVAFAATDALDVDVSFLSYARDGEQPWGASFAFNDAVEVPVPIDQRTNDFGIGASWANPKGMIRLSWNGSWFNNDVQSLVWDNPIRLTDFSNGLAPPNGPYDPSGYSNGNGAAQGRMALAPSNSSNVFGTTALYRIAPRTSVNGTLQFTTQEQDEDLIPWTINPLINTASVFALFPRLATLPRPTAEAKAQGVNALLNFNTRPFTNLRNLSFTARYRYNERDNQTPTFDATEYVRFDAVPEEIEEGLSHQYDTTRHNFDVNASYSLSRYGALRAGYGHEAYERHGRGFSEVGENIIRLSYDTYALNYVNVRVGFDHGRRRGEGFVEQGIDYELGPGGTQPGLRYYDEADRDRTRGSVMLSVDPTAMVSVYFSYAGGTDEYLADESVPAGREFFGLLDSKVNSYNLGLTLTPRDSMLMGLNYGRDSYSALQKSRNANPPPDPTWTDPNRNWTMDNEEKVNNFNVWVDLLQAFQNTDIRFGYDFSDSNNAFEFGGPRIPALAALNQFIPLPDVDNTWHRVSADVKYFFTRQVGVGLAFFYEQLDIVDFSTINAEGPSGVTATTDDPRIDWLGGLITGYGNRPYSGSNVFVRLLYRF